MLIRVAALGVALLLSIEAQADIDIFTGGRESTSSDANIRKIYGVDPTPRTCNELLLALHTPALDSYFSRHTHSSMYFKRQPLAGQKQSEADKAFENLLSDVALHITSFYTDRIPLVEGEEIALKEVLNKDQIPYGFDFVYSWTAGAERLFNRGLHSLFNRSFQPAYKVILFATKVDGSRISFVLNDTAPFKTKKQGSLKYRQLYCRFQVFLPWGTPPTSPHQLHMPFVIDNCKHEVLDGMNLQTNQLIYARQATHPQMSFDAVEYAQILALEHDFKWPAKWRLNNPLAQGVISLSSSTTDSLRLRAPTQAEFQFVSSYNDEPITIDLLKK